MTEETKIEVKTVAMVRNPEQFSAPHSADVNEAEVDSFRAGGFVLLDEATFEVPQAELPLAAPAPVAVAAAPGPFSKA